MFLNISFKSNKKWIIVVVCITIIMLSVSIGLMLNAINRIENGSKLEEKIDVSFENYHAHYDMTIVSNKNINTYSVHEWHKAGDLTKLQYLDYMKNSITITLKGNNCNIVNSGNTAKLVINNMIDNKNIASLSTFSYLYNNMNGQCNCVKTQYTKEEKIIVTIKLADNCSCSCNKIKEQLGISKLELTLENNIPINYIVLDKNEKEYISIVYNVYEQI